MSSNVYVENSEDPDQTADPEQSDLVPHCLSVCRNKPTCSRQLQQMKFSDAFIRSRRWASNR